MNTGSEIVTIVVSVVLLVGQHVYEGDGEHASAAGALDLALHPVIVLGALVDDDYDLSLAERQLVLVVGRTVVESSTPPRAAHL